MVLLVYMRPGKQKSNTFRSIKKRLPSGKLTTHYVKRRHNPVRCAETGQILPGVARNSDKASKSQKRPERPYGGVLSSKALRRKIIQKSRSEE